MAKKTETEKPVTLREQDLKRVEGAGTKQLVKKTLDQEGVTHIQFHGSDFNAAKPNS